MAAFEFAASAAPAGLLSCCGVSMLWRPDRLLTLPPQSLAVCACACLPWRLPSLVWLAPYQRCVCWGGQCHWCRICWLSVRENPMLHKCAVRLVARRAPLCRIAVLVVSLCQLACVMRTLDGRSLLGAPTPGSNHIAQHVTWAGNLCENCA